MKTIHRATLAAALLALLLGSCAPSAGGGAPAAQPKVVVLADQASGGSLGRLASGATLAFRSNDPGISLQDQLTAILEESAPAAIVVYPAGLACGQAFARLRPLHPDTLLYAGLAAPLPDGDNLLLESSADLVAEVSPPSEAGALIKGLAELARRAALGKARSDSLEEFLAALRATSPGRGWTGSYLKDESLGIKARNHVTVGPAPGK